MVCKRVETWVKVLFVAQQHRYHEGMGARDIDMASVGVEAWRFFLETFRFTGCCYLFQSAGQAKVIGAT